MEKLRIVFMGTPDFAVPSLKALVDTPHELIAVVTRPDTHKGRGLSVMPSPVKVFALDNGLRVLQPDMLNNPSFKEELLNLSPDIIVIVAFKILPLDIISIPRLGSINLHGSLLPKYRGAAPIARAIAAGESETGLTVFFLGNIVDGGEIISQKRIAIKPDETAGELSDRMKIIGAELLTSAVNLIAKREVIPSKQDSSAASPAPKLKKEEGRIDFTLPASEIYNRIRAFTPVPGSYMFYNGKRIIVCRAAMSGLTGTGKPGTILRAGSDGLSILAGDGSAIDLVTLKPENKKIMTAVDFVNGFHIKKNEVFSD